MYTYAVIGDNLTLTGSSKEISLHMVWPRIQARARPF